MNWLILSLLAVPFFLAVELLYKFGECKNIDINLFIPILFLFVGIFSFLFILLTDRYNAVVNIDKNIMINIVLISLIMFLGQFMYWNSFKKSEIPGYSRAIFSGALILSLVLMSTIFFNKIIKLREAVGLLLIILGVYLLS
jgi:uncharacterized membrane protein